MDGPSKGMRADRFASPKKIPTVFAVKDVKEMSDEELIDRIRMLDDQIGPMIELKSNDRAS